MAILKSSTTKALEKKLGSYGTGFTSGMSSLLSQQKAEEEAMFGKYESAVTGQEKLGDAFTRLQTEQGVPELQETIGGFKGEIYKIKDLIDRLDEDITSRTSGTLTSEAQRRRQVAAEEEPLARTMSRLGTAAEPFVEQLNSTQQLIATQLGLVSQDQQKELQPLILRIEATSDRFAREITGYTTAKETELTVLLNKLDAQRALDKQEWDRVQEIAKEEREFLKEKQLIAARAAKSSGGGSSKTTSAKSQMQDDIKYMLSD
jgi:hypothetical protein